MASDEYFIKLGKSIAGPAKRERIEALWKAGKLAETAEVSPDKIHWETIKEFLEGKLADSVDLQQEDGEPDEFEEEVVKPKPKSRERKIPFQIGNPLKKPLVFVRIIWALSLVGFLSFWIIYDGSVMMENGNRLMNLHGMSIKSNGMVGCSVLLIICSLYIMAYHMLATLLRIEKSCTRSWAIDP